MGSAKKNRKLPATGKPAVAAAVAPESSSLHPRTFHLLTAGPPTVLLCFLLPASKVSTWFALWALWQYFPLPRELHVLGGRAITVYGAWRNLHESIVPRSDTVFSNRFLAACVIGLVMGVAYRNLIQALNWYFSDKPARPKGPDELSGRPAVRVSLRPDEKLAGKSVASMSRQGGAQLKKIHLTDAPPNVHGEREFMVKVQLPMTNGAGDGLGMVYDEQRSFQSFVDLESPDRHMATLTRLIATEGGSGGVKGYFMARRQGDELFIFVDKVLTGGNGRSW